MVRDGSSRLKRSIRKKNWSRLFDDLDENDDGVLNYQEFWKYKEIRTSMQLSDALNKFDVSEFKCVGGFKNQPTHFMGCTDDRYILFTSLNNT